MLCRPCWTWSLLLFLHFQCPRTFATRDAEDESDTAGLVDGHLLLGGLFRIRRTNGRNGCLKTVETHVGIQRVEAMLYAIAEVNRDASLLPNLTIGAEIRDTCSSKTKTLDESLKFIVDSLPLRPTTLRNAPCTRNLTRRVVGVVGPARSTLSIEVAKLLRLFKVPQVSYASTSTELSDARYSYFARTVPSDAEQVKAMLHVVKEFGWSSVFTVNSVGSYGESGMDAFEKRSRISHPHLCIVLSEQVSDASSPEIYRKIVRRFVEFPSTRAIILFLQDNHLKMLLRAAKEEDYQGRVWIASDEWGTRMDIVKDMDDFFERSDAVTLTIFSSRMGGFEKYFHGLDGNKFRRENPWFQQYWLQCGRNSTCDKTFNDKLSYVVDAVDVFARALDKIYRRKCPKLDGPKCSGMSMFWNGTELRDLIFNTTFVGRSSRTVSIDERGDSKGSYSIFHYTNGTNYVKIGDWRGKLHLDISPARLRRVVSGCNDSCNPWSWRKAKDGTTCCFKCIDCPDMERQYVVNETCFDCKQVERPNANHTKCEELPVRYVSTTWFITIAFFACLGVTCSLTVAALLLYHLNSPLMLASERDLTFLLLLGVITSYVVAFLFVCRTELITCLLQRVGSGLDSTLCYSSILMKIDRIGRIFAPKGAKSAHFVKPRTHLALILLLVTVKLGLSGVGLIIKPAAVIRVSPTRSDIFAKCNYGDLEYATSVPFNLLLILLCTFYSFRIRKQPSAFNEPKCIGLIMYSACVVGIASIPVKLGTPESYEPITMSLNATLRASAILACFFVPKICILVFKPIRFGVKCERDGVENFRTVKRLHGPPGKSVSDVDHVIPKDEDFPRDENINVLTAENVESTDARGEVGKRH